MNVQYCTSCGFKNVYGAVAPNFCGGCGANLKQLSSASVSTPMQTQQVSNENLEGNERIPNIQGLEYEIQGVQHQKLTIGDVVKQGPSSEAPRSKKRGRKPKAPTQDTILKESLDICKSAKFKPSEDIE